MTIKFLIGSCILCFSIICTQHVIQKQSQQKQICQINEIENDGEEENEGEENEPDTEERHWDVEEE